MKKDIFSILTLGDWNVLSTLGESLCFDSATKILGKGVNNSDLYFLVEGNVQAVIDERTDCISRIGSGEFIGEMSYLDGEPVSIDVIAEPGARLIRFSGKMISGLCNDAPGFAGRFNKYLAMLLAKRLRRNNQAIVELNSPSHENPYQLGRVIRLGNFEFRSLRNEDEIRQAQSLLNDIYIEEQGWVIVDMNPSRIRIERGVDGKSWLTDKFAAHAKWFGAFEGTDLIGCFRVLPYPRHELKEYMDVPVFLSHAGASELNRLAIRPEFRSHKYVSIVLMRASFDFALSLGPTVFVTAPTPYPSQLFEKLGLARTSLPPFKYNLNEDDCVDLLYGDTRFHRWLDTPLHRISEKLIEKAL